MLKLITSLSFLYAFAITVLLLYGIVYYRDFTRSTLYRRKFPYVFLLIAAACFAFLYSNIHAPLRLKTFSNLDHNFIRHDGFAVDGKIELGKSDTVNFRNNAFSRFVLEKKNQQVTVVSSYSEEPFYAGESGKYKIQSAAFPTIVAPLSLHCDSLNVTITAAADSSFELAINNNVFKTGKQVRKGLSVWNVFRDNDAFINSAYYTHEKLVSSLKHVFVLRDDVSRKESGDLKYFISGRLFQFARQIEYDQKALKAADLAFTVALTDETNIAWGIGFLDNNRNQFRVKNAGNDSFSLLNRFPVSYPLSEENNAAKGGEDWSRHHVNKFLVSDSRDLLNLAPVFREGFLFTAFSEDHTIGFSPVLLSYEKAANNEPLQLKARWLDRPARFPDITNNKLLLPASSSGFAWVFSIRNTYDWELGNKTLPAKTWQLLLFGSLLFFVVLIFLNSLVKPAHKLSWVTQLLSCITLVLLTTRFFLYWRYKSFPPYDGMDLPSLQQLNSFWNFGIIIFATILLAIVFGFDFLKYSFSSVRKQISRPSDTSFAGTAVRLSFFSKQSIANSLARLPFVNRLSSKTWFFISWLFLLLIAGGIASLSNFDSGTCRHLSIALMILYFIYVFISYQYSPLVKGADTSWWSIDTSRFSSLIISNPVKVLLSVSLLVVFAFIDIGFSIVFLNFLLFHEAFLCINYAVAGLSAGSKRNAGLFGTMGFVYLLLFVINLLYAPYIFSYLLELPQQLYLLGYIIFSILVTGTLLRVFPGERKWLKGMAITAILFTGAFLFFPKEKVLSKAGMTKYRIDVQIMPADKAITQAYEEGKTYEPVIRAAQNQWFINTFIHERNNPGVHSPAFQLLPHAPQNKGAKYNAQATDLVASRFFIAEHGKWSVLLYVLLLLLPSTMLASFYKLYPDFTSRVNNNYAAVTTGFSILNYVLVSALLVILAATGKYIFFGQDLPFGSILSKQSILVPSLFIISCVWLFTRIPQEHYANRRKTIPGMVVFAGLLLILLFVKPAFNKNREFAVENLAREMDSFIELRLQPVWDHFDTSRKTRRLSVTKKDRLFCDSVRKLLDNGWLHEDNQFFAREIIAYSRAAFSQHLDANRMLYLDVSTGNPQLAVNPNYFRVEPPPHLQHSWTGNVYADTTIYNIALWDAKNGSLERKRVNSFASERKTALGNGLLLSFSPALAENSFEKLYLVNKSGSPLQLKYDDRDKTLAANDSIQLFNPHRITITNTASHEEKILVVEPDAFMKNYFVNGNRFYAYPLGNRFTWARNFAESISSDHTADGLSGKDVFVSFDFEMMDSLSQKIKQVIGQDTAYKEGAEYGICIADGNGRLITMVDFIKGMDRPDPNDKAGFYKAIHGDGGFISQSLLRKQIGNTNLLRLNPGPGSTLKPIVFSAIASQLNLDWDAFSAEGFSEKQHYYGGEKVAEYDFEKNNGRISNVIDYLKYSDNYYHSNLLLLGSYPKQEVNELLSNSFVTGNPEQNFHWPYFNYRGTQYYLDEFQHWPGYNNGKASFGSDSSFISIGLLNNYGIHTRSVQKNFDRFSSSYDSLLFLSGWKKSGFILPEYALFDQQARNTDHRIPYDLFATGFRGHVKGSSQVMIAPVKMLEAFGKLISQSRNYSLTLNPYASPAVFSAFYVDEGIGYNNYLSLVRENIFAGMKEALFSGTAARLGSMLTNGAPYYYYAKTGTTGDNETKTKSKLMTVIISQRDIANPGFNFRGNPFYAIYFTSQNGPARQNEELQAEVIRYIQQSTVFKRYMVSENRD